MALSKAGFRVKAICPQNHPLTKTGAAQELFPYQGLSPVASFTQAIAAAKPDIIIPGNDLATQHLHEVYFQSRTSNGNDGVRAVIERSLGSRESFTVIQSRTRTMEIAREEGIRAPETEVVANLQALRGWIARNGLPVVLKSDGSSGGSGVKIASTVEDAEQAFLWLARAPNWISAVKRALLEDDTTQIVPALQRRRRNVNAQRFVPGREATSTVVCWGGRVLAAIHCEVLRKTDPTGPATVLRLIEDAEMSAAAQKMARRLRLSGVHGFDFMREGETGNAYLIEINPRTTQVGHLALGPGRDLPAALYAAVRGENVQPAPAVTDKDTVALFPSEWIRDSSSPYLRSAHHDVPWEEADLVRACIRSRRRKITWFPPKDDFQAFREWVTATYDSSVAGPPFAI